ncbi:MAG TPA: VWA domain-containing protein [Thermomicrobiales bacterium]|nr:VWA domain-containing protein [Thermomicrobiales bacterium]
MDLLWPGFLLLLLAIPASIAGYIWVLRRRRRFAVRFSSLALVREAAPRAHWRRHLPFALFLAGLASLVLALVRPVAIVSVPTNQTTIILTIDVSRSMCSTDVVPNRLAAAESAALSFIQRQPTGTRIGIVAFSGFAEVIQAPTTDSELLQDAIRSLLAGNRTAIGSGILTSIDAVAQSDPRVAPSITATSPGIPPTPVPQGDYAPDIIVLLTDGSSNTGPAPLDAAQQAADRGLRVYTIGFGTPNGSELANCGARQGSEPFGGPPFGRGGGGGVQFGGSGRFRRGIDEDTLRQVAAKTGGQYYSAESAGQLQQVFDKLPTDLIVRHETTELSVAFAALGALLAATALVLSLLWHPLL